MEINYSLSLYFDKLMETGPNGKAGENVRCRVAVDIIPVQGLAPTLLQGMAGRIALDKTIRLVLVTHNLVQV